MDEEERNLVSEKGWKAAEAVFVSGGDDRAGRSVMKLEASKSPKRVKTGLGGMGAEGKLVDEGLDLGGVEETLSSLKRKMRGLKGDSGSERVRVPDMNLVERSDQPLTGAVGDASLDVKVGLSNLEIGCSVRHHGGVENANPLKINLSTKAVYGLAAGDGNPKCLGFAEDQVIIPCGQDALNAHADECCNSDRMLGNDGKQLNCLGLKDSCVESRSQFSFPEENNPQLCLENHAEKTVSSSVLLQKENVEIFDKQPLPLTVDLSREPSESELDKPNDSVPSNQKPILNTNKSMLSYDGMDGEISHRGLEKNEYCHKDVVLLPKSGNQGNKLSTSQRTTRKTKKRRHDDMAYEGDADWDNLINEHGFLDRHQGFERDQSMRTRDRLQSSSSLVTDVEDDGTIAVSAGLKAHAVVPAEKLKFKEVLKRKYGLQEYLKCRNYILHLWNKDVSRTLDLADCGVADNLTDDELAHASLIRKIYTFLDGHGYINFGVASRKEKTEPVIKHSYKIIKEKPVEGISESSGANSEDGVSFIFGQVRNSETFVEEKNTVEVEDENRFLGSEEIKAFVQAATSQSLSPNEKEEIRIGRNVEIDSINSNIPEQFVRLSAQKVEPSCESLEGGKSPDKSGEEMDVSYSELPSTECRRNPSYKEQCDKEVQKNIIVVGAGPAGLTAARHLQRQGFSVTVLEARNRVGGRVYTDRSSLSVPVDLGASIITGVEADLATERRPDPSSLICAQLGLELTVLNSDCPLYDTVTGNKVPADLDEDLEAEYNSLLDDMVLLVAQQGKKAMDMSLEDGLEYALMKRRMSKTSLKIEEPGWKRSADTLCHLKHNVDGVGLKKICSEGDILSPLERRVMNWHFAHLEYGCAALLKEVSLPHWNQDDAYGGFGGAHCMIKGGYSAIVESLGTGISIHLNHIVSDISYSTKGSQDDGVQHKTVKVSTSNGREFSGDAVLITVPLGCLKAGAIKFSPPLPPWKQNSIQRLGFGVLNKVVMEFSEVFWDDSLDYFGATAEETDQRGHCFMFWNVRKTVGAPVLIALVVGKAARDGQCLSSSDHVNHALRVLRKLFGDASVPNPVASVVTDWGSDPFSYGAYSYVAIGASGEDYDLLARPVENCLFFAGEATCKENPDTVGGAMISGLREAVRIIDILRTGIDYTAEMEAMEAVHRYSDCERDEVRDFTTRLDAVKISNSFYKHSLEGTRLMSREALMKEMFFSAKTTAGRLILAKELLKSPVGTLKSFAGTKRGLATLNSWILDSLGKDGTQLLRQCVRILVRVATDLLAVRLSGIGKTIKEKVCVHTSRDIRAIASQLTSVWLETFHKEKASGRLPRLLKQGSSVDSSRRKLYRDSTLGNPTKQSHDGIEDKKGEDDYVLSEEEKAAIAAAEKAHAAALAAAEAYKSSEAKCNSLQLPKIPSFHKFIRRERCAQTGENDPRRKSPGGVLGRKDVKSDIRSRSSKVIDWSVDNAAACVNLDSSRMSGNNLSQQSHPNECFREHTGERPAISNNILTKAWVDSTGSAGIKDFNAIERWQSQAAAAAGSDVSYPEMNMKDEEDSNTKIRLSSSGNHKQANEGSVSQVSVNKEPVKSCSRGPDRIKQAVVDFVGSLLMPLYKAKKLDKDGYKSIMKKTTTKVMEQATDAEKAMSVNEFLHYKRKSKIRDLVDIFIVRHTGAEPLSKP